MWETIKCVVRGDTIRYSARKAKARNKMQNILENEIVDLELQYSQTLDPNVFVVLEAKKRNLEDIYSYKAKGAMIRSKARWVEDGEKTLVIFSTLRKDSTPEKIFVN